MLVDRGRCGRRSLHRERGGRCDARTGDAAIASGGELRDAVIACGDARQERLDIADGGRAIVLRELGEGAPAIRVRAVGNELDRGIELPACGGVVGELVRGDTAIEVGERFAIDAIRARTRRDE